MLLRRCSVSPSLTKYGLGSTTSQLFNTYREQVLLFLMDGAFSIAPMDIFAKTNDKFQPPPPFLISRVIYKPFVRMSSMETAF